MSHYGLSSACVRPSRPKTKVNRSLLAVILRHFRTGCYPIEAEVPMRYISYLFVSALMITLTASPALARTVTAGEVWAHAGLGYAGVSSANVAEGKHSLALHTEIEFDLSRWGGLVGGVAMDLSSSTQIDLEAGLRLRVPGLESAWSPHVDISYLLGGYTNIDGENLLAHGSALALGTEFFLTRDLMAGISLEWTQKSVTAFDSPIHSVGLVLTLGRELKLY